MSIFSTNFINRKEINTAVILESYFKQYAKNQKKSECFSDKRVHEICNEAILNNTSFIDGILWESAAREVESIIDKEVQ